MTERPRGHPARAAAAPEGRGQADGAGAGGRGGGAGVWGRGQRPSREGEEESGGLEGFAETVWGWRPAGEAAGLDWSERDPGSQNSPRRRPRGRTAGRASMPPLLHPALPLLLGATLTFRALRRALSRLPLPVHVRADPLRTWRWHNLLVSFAHSIVSGIWALLW